MGTILVLAIVGVGAWLVLSPSALGDTMYPSSDQVRQYAANAGFSEPDLSVAVAIAMAESSDNAQALGDPNLGISVGLWQINLKAHPEYTQVELYDPQTNANAAFAIYSAAGNSFSPWSTFNSGAYQQYL